MSSTFTQAEDLEFIQYRFLDANGKISKKSVLFALKPPYPAKYYINIVLFTIVLTVFLLWDYGVIPGVKRGFFCNDPIFLHKYNGDTITTVMLGIGTVLCYLFSYFIVECIRQEKFRNIFSWPSFFELYFYTKQSLIGAVLALGFSEIAKTVVGEHRPHFFDTCMPDTNFNCTNGTYIHTYSCTNQNVSYGDQIDSSRSFPSGHSSLSWFIAMYSAYIIHSRLPVYRSGTILKITMLLFTQAFGITCSLTRITDRRHHWWDVLAGTVIGVVAAAYVIRTTEKHIRIIKEQTSSESNTEAEEEFAV